MEQSKNKRANNMLRFVIGLCIVAVAVITVFTASARREEKPITDSEAKTELTSDTGRTSENTRDTAKESDTNITSAKDTAAAVVNDETVKESESVKSEDLPKSENVKPTVVEEKETFDLPVVGTVTKEYAIDTPVFSMTMNDYRAHTGIDIACEEGCAVGAAASGVVKEIVNDPMMGTSITIEHADGVASCYMNLNETLPDDITVGSVVEKGQLIGAVGNSAIVEIASEPHLHFEMTVSGAYVDPLTLLDTASISVMSENIVE